MAGDDGGAGGDLEEGAGGKRTPRDSSSEIPTQDIKKEEDTRRPDVGLTEAWHKYKQFESYRYWYRF
jgi:hypothetical protein